MGARPWRGTFSKKIKDSSMQFEEPFLLRIVFYRETVVFDNQTVVYD